MKKNNFPLVSVIMNCYNGEKFLKKSVTSLLNQNYKKWELIFWDNKSQDKSKKFILSFKDKRIRYFQASRFTSLYAARNLAIKQARGKFICFLDTDDWWIKSKLSIQVKLIKKNTKIKFIYSNIYLYDQEKKIKKILSKKKLPSGQITQNLLDDYKIGILSVMISKNFFRKKKFNSNYNIIGDFDFFLKLSIQENFYCIQKPLAYYRVHSRNYSKNYDLYYTEFNKWLKLNSSRLKKLNYSLKKVNFLNYKLKIKKLFRLGP